MIKRAICINCGRDWGDHCGIDCQRRGYGMTRDGYIPEGYDLQEKCELCDERLIDHKDRMHCTSNVKGPFFKRKPFFSEGEFTL